MKKYMLYPPILFSFILGSCNSTRSVAVVNRQSLFKDTGHTIEPTLFTINTDATQRIAIVLIGKDGKLTTFSENPPDAAIQSMMSLLAKADVGQSVGKVNAQSKLDFAKTIAQLGKRSEAINYHRDGLFRLSEMYNNGAIEKPNLIALIDSLQKRSVQMASLYANLESQAIKLDILKELQNLFAQSDSTTNKLTQQEIERIIYKHTN